MQMSINNIDVSKYGCKLINLDIQPANINNTDEWLRDSLVPLYIHQQFEYKVITTEILFIGNDKEDVLKKSGVFISNLSAENELKFDDMEITYKSKLNNTPQIKKTPIKNKLVLTCTFNAIACGIEETKNFVNNVTINIDGSDCPAILTINPMQDIDKISLTGLGEDIIKINRLKSGVPVTLNGEKSLVYEPDLDYFVTSEMGANKWIYKFWNISMSNSPELTSRPNIIPTKDMINKSISCYHQEFITDSTNLVYNEITNIIGSIKTGLYVSTSRVISLQLYHDDGVTVYCNGTDVYRSGNAEINTTDNPNYPTITFTLNVGWNTLEFVYINHLSQGGVYNFKQKLSDLVEQVNCYYARDLEYLEQANKFPECDLWEFPRLRVGNNTINIDNTNLTSSIAYKPRYL